MAYLISLFQIDVTNLWLLGAIKAGIILAGFSAALIFSVLFLRKILGRVIRFFQSPPDEHLISTFYKLINRLLLLVTLDVVIDVLPMPAETAKVLNDIVFVLTALLMLAAAFEATHVVSGVMRLKAREFEPLVTKILGIFWVLLAVMVVMGHFNYSIWHIMTALGVGTLAVGLAAQPTLSNMIAGFTILIDRPFRPGDRIKLGADEGDVHVIGMRSTRILTPDGNMLIISNSDLVNSRVINFSLPTLRLGHKVKFYFEHDAPLDDIKPILKNVAESVDGVVKSSVNVYATNVNEWAIEVGAFFQVEHYANTGLVTDRVIDALINELRKRHISFATQPPSPGKKLS